MLYFIIYISYLFQKKWNNSRLLSHNSYVKKSMNLLPIIRRLILLGISSYVLNNKFKLYLTSYCSIWGSVFG